MSMDENMDAVSLRQSVQLHTMDCTKPGGVIGWRSQHVIGMVARTRGGRDKEDEWDLTKASCTAPQKHVAVAEVSLDQPSVVPPASGR